MDLLNNPLVYTDEKCSLRSLLETYERREREWQVAPSQESQRNRGIAADALDRVEKRIRRRLSRMKHSKGDTNAAHD